MLLLPFVWLPETRALKVTPGQRKKKGSGRPQWGGGTGWAKSISSRAEPGTPEALREGRSWSSGSKGTSGVQGVESPWGGSQGQITKDCELAQKDLKRNGNFSPTATSVLSKTVNYWIALFCYCGRHKWKQVSGRWFLQPCMRMNGSGLDRSEDGKAHQTQPISTPSPRLNHQPTAST